MTRKKKIMTTSENFSICFEKNNYLDIQSIIIFLFLAILKCCESRTKKFMHNVSFNSLKCCESRTKKFMHNVSFNSLKCCESRAKRVRAQNFCFAKIKKFS